MIGGRARVAVGRLLHPGRPPHAPGSVACGRAQLARLAPALIVVLAARAFAQATPPELEAASAEARTAGKPLVVQFSTSWCAPCRLLEQQVLPDPVVKAALSGVRFVQYDAEHGPGRAAAARLEVSTYPTLVALDAEGAPIDRLEGVRPPVALAAWLQGVIERARPSLPQLLAQREERPKDAALALSIGRRQLDAGARVEARRSFVVAAKNAAKGSGTAAAAALELMRLDIGDAEHAARARIARGFLARFPAGEEAVATAEIYSLALPPRAEAEELLGRVVAAQRESPGASERAGRLVLACLRAGALDAALAGVDLLPSDAAGTALAAEVHHQRGDREAALRFIDRALAEPGPGRRAPFDRASLEASRERYRRGDRAPGDTLLLSDPVDAFRLPPPPASAGASPPPPPDPRQEAMQRRMQAFRQLVARVARACGGFARLGPRRVWVRVQLKDRRVDRVQVLESSLPVMLEGCISSELTGRSFVHPIEGEDTFAIQF